MALASHVTDRFGANTGWLRNLTNQDDDDATTINATRLAEAASSAEGQFPIYAGVVYDDTNEGHIDAGVRGVIAFLRMWSSVQGKSDALLTTFRKELRSIRAISAGKRPTPVKADPVARPDNEDLFLGVSPEFPTISESP